VGADNTKYVSETFSFEVITQVAGRIDSADDNVGDVTDPLTSGARTDDTTPTLKGVGTPNGIVTIYDNWIPLGSAKINAQGEWSFTPSRELREGTHNFHATVTGPDGTTLPASPIFTLDIVPFVPPIEYFAPTITNVYDDEVRHNYLQNGGMTDDTTPRFSGRGMPNTKIDVLLDAQKIGEADINFMGYWSFTSAQPLASGHHSFSFVTVGADDTDYASETFSLEVITQVVARIDFAEDNVGDVTDPLTSGARTDDTTPTLHGVGTANGIVKIYNGYSYLGSAKITAKCTWSFTPQFVLQDGTHRFRATVTGPDGTQLPESQTFSLTITKPVEYSAPLVLEILDDVGNPSNLWHGNATDDTTPTFNGYDVPNSKIQVRINDQDVVKTEVNSAGRWSYTPQPALQPGKHSFTFVSITENGRRFASDVIELEVFTPITGRITSADDNVGDLTDPLTSGARTDDATPTLRGVDTPGGTVEILRNGETWGFAEINEKGEWSFTPTRPLANGESVFSAEVTNPDGTTLPAGPTFSLIIDAPVLYSAPVIDGVMDNVHGQTILSDGDTTDDATPTFVGKALADSTIAVYVNDKYYGDAKVDPWGDWVYRPSPALNKSEHTFSFVSVDDKGGEYRSEAFTLHIDPAIPLAILSADDDVGAVTDPLFSGCSTDDTQPTLRGTGTPGSIIEIFGTGGLYAIETISPEGNWSWTPDQPLSAGSYQFIGVIRIPGRFEYESTNEFALTITTPEIDRSIDMRSLLQDGDTPLFDEPQAELSTRQPIEPIAFVPASDPLVQDWETTKNHY